MPQFPAVAEEFAACGYRSLGVARSGAGRPWRLLGVLPLADPPGTTPATTVPSTLVCQRDEVPLQAGPHGELTAMDGAGGAVTLPAESVETWPVRFVMPVWAGWWCRCISQSTDGWR